MNNKIIINNGIDNIKNYSYLLKNKRLGLVTNVTGLDKHYKSTVDIINENYDLKLIFAPEHGLRGEYQAGEYVENYIDKMTGIEVISLYGEKKAPNSSELEQIDVLIYDIQDLGIRYYTYIYTMYLCMKACSENNIEFVILDRINPLGGTLIEGNILEEKYKSFVGMLPITNTYSLTVGELANYINQKEKIMCNLNIINVTGWRRGITIEETDLPWISPSPNIPTLKSAFIYGGTCLFEGTNLSEGRGTTKPFEIIGAPWINCYELSKKLNNKNLAGVYFRPIFFIPSMSKYKNELCQGVEIHIINYEGVSPIVIALNILYEVKNLYPEDFSSEIYSKDFKYNFFNHLLGCNDLFKSEIDEVINNWRKDSEIFKEEIKGYLLY